MLLRERRRCQVGGKNFSGEQYGYFSGYISVGQNAVLIRSLLLLAITWNEEPIPFF